MFNRRALLAAIGLTLPALAAEAATKKKAKTLKPVPHGTKTVSHKTHRTTKPAPIVRS